MVRQIVGIALREAGYRVYTAASPSEGVGLASEIVLSGERLLVVTDLGMPSSSGRSFRGGFELVRTLKRNEIEAPILLMAEKLSHKARERARDMGVHKVALKPALSKLDPEQYEKDLKAFAAVLLPILQGLHAVSPVDEEESLPAKGEDKTSAPFLDFITSMTEQLLNPRRSTDVSGLVIEIASKYLERGILFLIKGEMVCGISGFGLVSTEAANRDVAKGIRFNAQQARPFAEVAYSGTGSRFSAELDSLQASLYAAIGRGRASECVLMPMLNNGEVLVILYGDNASSGRPIGKLRGLELFMGQAGMALENTFLHQKLRLFESRLSRDSKNELAEVHSEST
jgi:CheY-like chemotaxis protein